MIASPMIVHPALTRGIKEVCLGLDSSKEVQFWSGIENLIKKYAKRNRDLLNVRDKLQQDIDVWYDQHPDIAAHELGSNEEYVNFLKQIGYLVPEENVEATTSGVDPEIGCIAGPQLVCPIDKARFALKACNGRWGSLFDAIYASNVCGDVLTGPFSEERSQQTIQFVDKFFDEAFPLKKGLWGGIKMLSVLDGKLSVDGTQLQDENQFVGFDTSTATTKILLQKNGLHVEIVLDRTTKVGKVHHAGISDVILESALTAILDMEDSVSVVDAEDKAVCYNTFAGVMRGSLSCTMEDGQVRSLAGNRGPYTKPGTSTTFSLPSRAVALIRNVGLSMYTDMVTYHGEDVPEHFVDAMATGLCALHDFARPVAERNSKAGSVYIVKPKMHGPDEVSMVNEMFDDVEMALGLPPCSLKIGIMDEERRTTVNLSTCIARAKDRIVFINTGFLDRVGDEIHTSMKLGPFMPKSKIRQQPFLKAYEDYNVLCGLAAKFQGKAQIGKGMWAEPDNMAGMLKAKIGHPKAGANCAWVPSPAAGTVHAMHYHMVDVLAVQKSLANVPRKELLKTILCPPVMSLTQTPPPADVQRELEENCQSILGYVVRWVENGVGCSKVPDLNNVQLMEDRATLRISSQFLANWLLHQVIIKADVDIALQKMALIVDEQNKADKAYVRMGPQFDSSFAFQAAKCLIFDGSKAPSGLTEPVLHRFRRMAKARDHITFAAGPRSAL